MLFSLAEIKLGFFEAKKHKYIYIISNMWGGELRIELGLDLYWFLALHHY
jgi:hypothetical protein